MPLFIPPGGLSHCPAPLREGGCPVGAGGSIPCGGKASDPKSAGMGSRGAALVVALGLLSLVLLLVTTFVLVMRSDRISASASRAHAYGRECSSLAPYFVGCYLLPQPHDTLHSDTTNYFLPRTDWLDQCPEQSGASSAGPEEAGDSSDDPASPDVLSHVYGTRGLTVREFASTFRDGIAAIEGAEISGQEAVFLGPDPDAAFASYEEGARLGPKCDPWVGKIP